MSLFKTANEIVPFLPVNESFPFEKIEPYLKMVERDVIKKLLGDQYTTLHAAYQADSMSAEQTALLTEVRIPLANLAFYEGMDVIAIQFGSLGAYTSEDGQSKAVSNTQLYHVKRSIKSLGYKGLETLLEFLEENKADYSDWTSDAVYTERRSLFVLGADDFSKNFNRRISRWVYWNLIPIMSRVQKDLFIDLFSQELYDEILTENQSDTVSANNQVLLDLIKPALCHATFVKGIEQLVVGIDDEGVTIFSQENLRNIGEARKNAEELRIGIIKREAELEVGKYLTELKDTLDDNLDDYPLYRDNAYDEDSTEEFENDDDVNYYYTG